MLILNYEYCTMQIGYKNFKDRVYADNMLKGYVSSRIDAFDIIYFGY